MGRGGSNPLFGVHTNHLAGALLAVHKYLIFLSHHRCNPFRQQHLPGSLLEAKRTGAPPAGIPATALSQRHGASAASSRTAWPLPRSTRSHNLARLIQHHQTLNFSLNAALKSPPQGKPPGLIKFAEMLDELACRRSKSSGRGAFSGAGCAGTCGLLGLGLLG